MNVEPVSGASGYLYGFFENGAAVWENYPNERTLSGTDYTIKAGTPVVPAGIAVPMGWSAGGDPAQLVAPDDWQRISELIGPLDYPGTVFGVSGGDSVVPDIAQRYGAAWPCITATKSSRRASTIDSPNRNVRPATSPSSPRRRTDG